MEIEVTQADRDAANLAFNVWDNTNELALAFARHRALAFAAGRASREREIVEWLRELAAEYKRLRLTFQAADCNNIADAIERGEV